MRSMISRWPVAVGLCLFALHAAFAVPTAHTGTVLETMDSGGYTYIKVDEGGNTYWAAGPRASVTVGAQVSFMEQMWMRNFTSKTLNRTFEKLMFIGKIDGASAHPAASVSAAPAASAAPVTKAEGGYTVAEIFAGRHDLKGKLVKVRGRVVKVSENIMDRTWVHLEDGTGVPGDDRLIFRSRAGRASVGSVVTAEGVVDTDKDFGYGYQYSVLVEDATFAAE